MLDDRSVDSLVDRLVYAMVEPMVAGKVVWMVALKADVWDDVMVGLRAGLSVFLKESKY